MKKITKKPTKKPIAPKPKLTKTTRKKSVKKSKQSRPLPKYFSILKVLVRDLYAIQKLRIGSQNRCWTLVNVHKRSKSDALSYQKNVVSQLKPIEEWLTKEISKELKEYPIWTEWLKNVKGIGPRLAGSIIALIFTITRFPTISCLWSYAGLAVDKDGKAVRRKKGQKLTWNPLLKNALYKLGDSFVKATSGGYRKLYDTSREHYNKKYADKPKVVPFLLAKRWTVKMFLAHLFEKWYELEGKKPPAPYIMAKDKKLHQNYIPPVEK